MKTSRKYYKGPSKHYKKPEKYYKDPGNIIRIPDKLTGIGYVTFANLHEKILRR